MTVVGISLKMYLSAERTRRWLSAVREVVAGSPPADEMFVLPTFPLLESAVSLLAASGIAVGAQDVAATEDGAQTGEVSASVLAELGCRYVAVGHAERRAAFGETDAVVAAKAAVSLDHGLTPVVCIGEPERGDADGATAFCRGQLEPVLAGCGDRSVLVAYEPVWAIGATAPAPAEHVRAVADGLRPMLGDSRLVYGGSAGPGLFAALAGSVDGLFLGRFAHDPAAVAATLRELATADRRGADA